MNMSLFSKILEKLGLKHEQPTSGAVAAKPAAPPKPSAAPVAEFKPTAAFHPATPASSAPKPQPNPAQNEPVEAAPAPKPVAISEVDVVKKLEELAAANPLKLNWKTSISDLLFLLGLENSYEARKELAVELGCPAELMHDSAKMNTWLHKTVLKKIAENGGNIPKELMD
jgi:hypothetical protein